MTVLALDLLGEVPNNLITQTFNISQPDAAVEVQVYVPESGLFHTEVSKPILTYQGEPLVLGVDYDYIYVSRHAESRYSVKAYGGVVILNKLLTGTFDLTANFLGGGYQGYSLDTVATVVELIQTITPLLYWDDVVDAPYETYPLAEVLPAEHINTGLTDLVSALHGLNTAIIKTGDSFDPRTTTLIDTISEVERLLDLNDEHILDIRDDITKVTSTAKLLEDSIPTNDIGLSNGSIISAAVNSSDSRYGSALVADSNRLVVGSPGNGRIDIFKLNSKREPTYQDFIAARNDGSEFGHALGLSGNTLVGADIRSGGIVLSQYTILDDGDTILADTWAYTEDNQPVSIAMYGDYLLVGIPSWAIGVRTDAGLVRVYKLKADGKYGEILTLTPPSPTKNGRFGSKIATDGNKVIISGIDSTISCWEFVGDEIKHRGEVEADGNVTGLQIYNGLVVVGTDEETDKCRFYAFNYRGRLTLLHTLVNNPSGHIGQAVAFNDCKVYVGEPNFTGTTPNGGCVHTYDVIIKDNQSGGAGLEMERLVDGLVADVTMLLERKVVLEQRLSSNDSRLTILEETVPPLLKVSAIDLVFPNALNGASAGYKDFLYLGGTVGTEYGHLNAVRLVDGVMDSIVQTILIPTTGVLELVVRGDLLFAKSQDFGNETSATIRAYQINSDGTLTLLNSLNGTKANSYTGKFTVTNNLMIFIGDLDDPDLSQVVTFIKGKGFVSVESIPNISGLLDVVNLNNEIYIVSSNDDTLNFHTMDGITHGTLTSADLEGYQLHGSRVVQLDDVTLGTVAVDTDGVSHFIKFKVTQVGAELVFDRDVLTSSTIGQITNPHVLNYHEEYVTLVDYVTNTFYKMTPANTDIETALDVVDLQSTAVGNLWELHNGHLPVSQLASVPLSYDTYGNWLYYIADVGGTGVIQQCLGNMDGTWDNLGTTELPVGNIVKYLTVSGLILLVVVYDTGAKKTNVLTYKLGTDGTPTEAGELTTSEGAIYIDPRVVSSNGATFYFRRDVVTTYTRAILDEDGAVSAEVETNIRSSNVSQSIVVEGVELLVTTDVTNVIKTHSLISASTGNVHAVLGAIELEGDLYEVKSFDIVDGMTHAVVSNLTTDERFLTTFRPTVTSDWIEFGEVACAGLIKVPEHVELSKVLATPNGTVGVNVGYSLRYPEVYLLNYRTGMSNSIDDMTYGVISANNAISDLAAVTTSDAIFSPSLQFPVYSTPSSFADSGLNRTVRQGNFLYNITSVGTLEIYSGVSKLHLISVMDISNVVGCAITNGKLVVTNTLDTGYVYTIESDGLISTIPDRVFPGINHLAWTAMDGKIVYTHPATEIVTTRDIETGAIMPTEMVGWVTDTGTFKDIELLICKYDGVTTIYDYDTRELLFEDEAILVDDYPTELNIDSMVMGIDEFYIMGNDPITNDYVLVIVSPEVGHHNALTFDNAADTSLEVLGAVLSIGQGTFDLNGNWYRYSTAYIAVDGKLKLCSRTKWLALTELEIKYNETKYAIDEAYRKAVQDFNLSLWEVEYTNSKGVSEFPIQHTNGAHLEVTLNGFELLKSDYTYTYDELVLTSGALKNEDDVLSVLSYGKSETQFHSQEFYNVTGTSEFPFVFNPNDYLKVTLNGLKLPKSSYTLGDDLVTLNDSIDDDDDVLVITSVSQQIIDGGFY